MNVVRSERSGTRSRIRVIMSRYSDADPLKRDEQGTWCGTVAAAAPGPRGDCYDLERDKGPNALDTRHSFNGTGSSPTQ